MNRTRVPGLLVRRTQCGTCIYRPDSPLDIEHLENEVRDPFIGFRGFRACHSEPGATTCCRIFWDRHKNEFADGQIAIRLNAVYGIDRKNRITHWPQGSAPRRSLETIPETEEAPGGPGADCTTRATDEEGASRKGRPEMNEKAGAERARFEPSTTVHPEAAVHNKARVSSHVLIEKGVQIGADTTIDIGCRIRSDTIIGRGCHLLDGTSTGKDVRIGDDVIVQSCARYGEDSYMQDGAQVGSRTRIKAGVAIGRGAVIGAGCTIGRGADIGDGAHIGDGAAVIAGSIVPPGADVKPGATFGERTWTGHRHAG